jgi:hypothetical protein
MEDDMTTTEISKFDDLIDIRDVIARVEELRELRGPVSTSNPDDDDKSQDELFSELTALESFLEECKGNGGDEQWEGDWYPVTCIRDSYFENYAQELAEDIGSIKSDAQWPYTCIDWEKAARELQMDYTSVEFDGITYWVR